MEVCLTKPIKAIRYLSKARPNHFSLDKAGNLLRRSLFLKLAFSLFLGRIEIANKQQCDLDAVIFLLNKQAVRRCEACCFAISWALL